MPDSFTHVTHQSYGSRVGNSCKGLIMGPILFVLAVVILVWNESNAVATHRALDEGARATISVETIDKIDPRNEGKLVHMIGPADTTSASMAQVTDAEFGVTPSSPTLKLRRSVEMYQWVESVHSETKKSTGGSTTTTKTYSYSKEWRSSHVESGRFNHPDGHQNPPLAFEQFVVQADPITFGKFVLSNAVTSHMNWYTRYPESISTENIPDQSIKSKAHVSGAGFYVGYSPTSPAVGDSKISYSVVAAPQTISLVAKQVGDTFAPYPTSNNKPILMVEQGSHSAQEMFEHAQAGATTMAWIVRFVGFLIMYFGLVSVIQPLATAADVLPFLGNMVEGATSCLMLPVALVISLVIIALSWIAVRPLLVIPLLALIGGGIYYCRKRSRESSGGGAMPIAQVVSAPEYQDDLELQASPGGGGGDNKTFT